ncbi:MAG TPA: right-handed parallel beta-helix repeat-containing protein [Armatimonadota bacterium]|jgi:hypothetical protein|nr:hypothetical protein [Armatimonadota bacterium]HOJ21937.1 right-handed parallel beta-helix repeat-containing protein [Armatimonadota bacterium]HOM81618.1 right-handed parallel beta-helix repeat-containing protein [Armatimonadota bacterium]HPT98444.1 right-handed parallel beta-helix repeat-containing protein [Armatimonadota bacterium]
MRIYGLRILMGPCVRGVACLLGLAAWLLPGAAMAQVQRNEAAIRDVRLGKIQEAKASWWGFDPDDSTRMLQEAINSGARKLIVDNVGKPWIVTGIALASNQEILFERGVEVLAKKGAFKGRNDSLFYADLKENITLTGYGATLRMRRADYDGPEYEKAEWRHCLSFRSCSNIKVYGLTLAESGGDGIYLGTAKSGVTNKDVHIKDVVCDRNYRQGISVITAENLLIENTVMKDTAGTAPQAGIDFEPNHPSERLVNCVMRNCITQNNKGHGYVLYLPPLKATSEPVSVRFENCRAIGDQLSSACVVTANTPDGAVKGTIEFINCHFEASKGAGINVSDKPANGCRVRFEKCTVVNPAAEAANQAPIVLMARQGAGDPIGGVEFDRCVIRDSVDRVPMKYVDSAGGVGIEQVTGTLLLEKDGKRQETPLTKELLAQWMPIMRLRVLPRFEMKGVTFKPLEETVPAEKRNFASARQRRGGNYVLYARQGDEVSLRFTYGQVGRYSGRTMPVMVTGPSGQEVQRAQVAFKEEGEVRFTAPETGLYRVKADPGGNYVRLLESSHAVSLSGDGQSIRLYISPGDYYFWVPEGVSEFAVRVFGEGLGEAVKATLLDPAGKVVQEVDNAAQTHQFEVKLAKPSAGEAWCLRLEKPTQLAMEDHYVDLRVVPPFLAPSKEALLIPVK